MTSIRRSMATTFLLGGLLLTGCEFIQLYSSPVSASIFADSGQGFEICTDGNRHCDLGQVVGPPDTTGPGQGRFVSLGGEGGYLIAHMSDPFTNGPGVDLRIYEVGSQLGGVNESFDVLVSRDELIWFEVAKGIRNDAGKTYASIDMATLVGSFRYIKIVDVGSGSGSSPGADIDAVEALWFPSS